MLAHTFIVLRSLQYLSIIPQLGSSWKHMKASESFYLAVGMGQAMICRCMICSHSSLPQSGSGLLQPSQQTAVGRQERTELRCYSCLLSRMPGCCDPMSDPFILPMMKSQKEKSDFGSAGSEVKYLPSMHFWGLCHRNLARLLSVSSALPSTELDSSYSVAHVLGFFYFQLLITWCSYVKKR